MLLRIWISKVVLISDKEKFDNYLDFINLNSFLFNYIEKEINEPDNLIFESSIGVYMVSCV